MLSQFAPAVKVRARFDSMHKDFPVGYLPFWANVMANGSRHIGADSKQTVPRLLLVDGQQRLTSLYGVLRGDPFRPVLAVVWQATRHGGKNSLDISRP